MTELLQVIGTKLGWVVSGTLLIKEECLTAHNFLLNTFWESMQHHPHRTLWTKSCIPFGAKNLWVLTRKPTRFWKSLRRQCSSRTDGMDGHSMLPDNYLLSKKQLDDRVWVNHPEPMKPRHGWRGQSTRRTRQWPHSLLTYHAVVRRLLKCALCMMSQLVQQGVHWTQGTEV